MKSPGEQIRELMEQRDWTQRDLSQILGKPTAAINEVLQGRRSISPEMAVALSAAFGTLPEEWLRIDAEFRLRLIDKDNSEVANRARLFGVAPIKDMQRRGWIHKVETIDGLRQELGRFFGVPSLDNEPVFVGSAKKTDSITPFNSAQRAWAFRAMHLAKCVPAGCYSETALETAVKKLKKLVGWPEQSRLVSSILADAGIRFVVVEPLPHTKIDGIAFWLDESSPVIAMSLRFDRVDNFWHTLGHEISHIRHRDTPRVDVALTDGERTDDAVTEIEARANRESAATWIDPTEIKSFIGRVGPLYSRDKINQFANRLKVHPGVIVGQLQFMDGLGFHAFKDAMVKVREYVISEALTDGWGHVVGL